MSDQSCGRREVWERKGGRRGRGGGEDAGHEEVHEQAKLRGKSGVSGGEGREEGGKGFAGKEQPQHLPLVFTIPRTLFSFSLLLSLYL
jgi:hypothetical protein